MEIFWKERDKRSGKRIEEGRKRWWEEDEREQSYLFMLERYITHHMLQTKWNEKHIYLFSVYIGVQIAHVTS